MSSQFVHGMRRRALGWMRPSVGKVGTVQVATGVLAVGAMFTGVSWQWWLVAGLGYFFYACVGHSVGYHRYFAHRSFQAPRWAEVMFTLRGRSAAWARRWAGRRCTAVIICTPTERATPIPRIGIGIRHRGRC